MHSLFFSTDRNILDLRPRAITHEYMPMHKVYHGAIVQDGVLVPSTGEIVLRIHSSMGVVSGTTTTEAQHLFSVFDFMNMVLEKTGRYAADEWKRLKSSGLKREIRQMKTGKVHADLAEMVDVKVKKRSKYKYIYVTQPAMSVKGLQWLLAQLGAEVDEFFRETVAKVLAAYMAGDRGMLGAGVACTTVTGRRTLNRHERVAVAGDADAVVHKRDRTLTKRALDRQEAGPARKKRKWAATLKIMETKLRAEEAARGEFSAGVRVV